MNLIYNLYERKMYNNYLKQQQTRIMVSNFRQYEYENKLKLIIEDVLNYIANNTIDTFKFEYEYELEESSINVKYYRTDYYTLTIRYEFNNNGNINGDTLTVRIPKLSDNHFFYLYGNKYIPVLKLKTYAIRYGRERLLIDGLYTTFIQDQLTDKGEFQPYNDALSVRILTNRKLLTNDFLYLLFKDDPFIIQIEQFLGTTLKFRKSRTYENFINHLSIFDKSDNKDINEIFTNMLFTPYTLDLFETELGFRPKSFKDIVKFIFQNYIIPGRYERTDLRDLRNRRFVFLESILKPFMHSAFVFLLSQSVKNYTKKFTMHRDSLINSFINGDSLLNIQGGKYLFDVAAPQAEGVRSNITVQMEGSEIKNFMKTLHPSHYGIICPISLSSSEPGLQLHVNPNTELTKHGHILTNNLFQPYNATT